MQFSQLFISTILAICTGFSSVTYATTKNSLIAESIDLPTVQPELPAESVSASQSRQTFFNHPPQLIRAAASQSTVYTPSTYEFTLTLPQDAGQPLKAVTIAQVENLETVKFDVSDSKAFVGERLTASSEIRLASIGGNQPPKQGEVTIVFDQPVQPGSTVTVTLAAERNPSWSNVYLFGVTAYPVGENSLGQFLGYGRIDFYGD
jgi:Protein of unknown function (DUF2808)